MTGLILMLAVAAVMVLFREPLGRGLVGVVEAAGRKRLVMLAVLLFLVWALLHHVQIVAGPMTGEDLAALLDGSVFTALFDAVAYTDLLVGVTLVMLNRRTRQMLIRLVGLVRPAAALAMRRIGRAIRTLARRRRPPDRDEPEPGAFGGVLAFS